MILTKRQIIDIEISKQFNGSIPNRFLKQLLGSPEEDFIRSVKKDLNWTLEPIRKHQYIVK